jgi:hypothetical protein
MAINKVAQAEANETEAESETQIRAARPLADVDRRCVYDHLAIACDQIGAGIAERHGQGDEEHFYLLQALTTLWRLRWEMGFSAGEVVADHGRETREELAAQRTARSKKGEAAE